MRRSESLTGSWDIAWHDKVEELAGRGFSLQALLKFYRGLGREYMPSFDPDKSTTSEVVRHAVIPLTCSESCAYATVMMEGVPTRPETMVTHTWSNVFTDLVAAVVSDALLDTTFEGARGLLVSDPDALEEVLEE